MPDSSLAALLTLAGTTPERTVAVIDGATVSAADLRHHVQGTAGRLAALPSVIAVALRNGIDTIAVELAAARLGKTLVHVPVFFSPGQIGHILRDSGAGVVLGDAHTAALLRQLGIRAQILAELPEQDAAMPWVPASGERLVYTSGTTGQPKGVRLTLAQIMASARRLVDAVGATSADRHFSALPQALLLEQVCGIHAPLIAGGIVHIVPAATEQAFAGAPGLLIRSLLESCATTTVLVPQLLAALVAGLAASGAVARSLRVVAVGGAAVPPALADMAERLGLPICEGYGLSECGSVVAMNRPGDRGAGTVGRPLPGLSVTIEDGEIVVEGGGVMQGYHAQPPLPSSRWPTGDLGTWDENGRLVVLGRKDNVLVTPLGRNISPEWIEAVLTASPLHPVLVTQRGDGMLIAIVCGPDHVRAIVEGRAEQLPAFARPAAYRALPMAEALRAGLFNAGGKANRAALRTWISTDESLTA